MSPTARSFLEVLQFDLTRTKKRMKDGKHLHSSFLAIGDCLDELFEDPEYAPSYREWRGNFFLDVYVLLKKTFYWFRYSPRKPKRQERIRGYRDKGSKSSDTEKARREANTSTWNEYLQEVLDYVELTGCSPKRALKLFGYRRE
jgi:hypothetical protein